MPSRVWTVVEGRRAAWIPAVLAVCATAAGCFSYVPIDTFRARQGEDVRVVLYPEAAQRVAQEYGSLGDQLIGQLTLVGPDSAMVAAWVGQGFSGTQFGTARQAIPLRRRDIAQVQRRQLSVQKTVLATAASVGLVAILAARLAAANDGPGEEPDPPPPPPPLDAIVGASRRVDLFRIRLPFGWR
jgi:hypothetical protein